MKHCLFIVCTLMAQMTLAQNYGPAQGFPSDPVISAAWGDSALYLGTQGSGVYVLTKERVEPAKQFKEFERSIIYDFAESDSGLVPQTKGSLSAYPIRVSNQRGTRFTIDENGLSVKFSDAAVSLGSDPSGIWRMTLGRERLNFLRIGSEIIALDSIGTELDRRRFKGVLFDLAPTDYGLLLSAESGYYKWNNGWVKVGSGLPIFAFDGPMARTPLGYIEINKLLEGLWSADDFVPLNYSRESYEDAYDVDSVQNRTYTFTSRGVEVRWDSNLLYTIDTFRELPDLKPGNYDVALIGSQLYVATPSGMYVFANEGRPNVPSSVLLRTFVDGIETPLDGQLVSPNSLSIAAKAEIESNAPLRARYRVNGGPWEIWDITAPLVLEYPAVGAYTLGLQVSTRSDFAGCEEQKFGFNIAAVWYKRPLIWGSILVVLAGLIIVWQQRERLRAKERLALQEQLAEAELRSKRGQMNPHFLFNALDAISNFIFKNQPKDAVLYMGKLAKLMRLTLESSRNTSMVLADEIDLLEKYVDMCKLRYGSFHWELTVEDGIDIYDRTLPPMLLQPLVENAVQHAVRPRLAKGEEGIIRCKVSEQNQQLIIDLKDNGPGVQQFNSDDNSHGLSIIQERLELLTKKHNELHTIRIDSMENDGLILGTHVSLILPTVIEE